MADRYRYQTAPCCEGCWNERHPGRRAMRMLEADDETCCYCMHPTLGVGIYVRERLNHDGTAVDADGVPLVPCYLP